ncbi:hypothetical protein XAC217_840012 [Xanthomonas citri pv. citri]|nr:hypothetical protein XACLC80_960017 [Xanthomonas citri pv. citri]CEF47308.1 hypothetical protein XAC217_840012 [Xanthomonas citri pv. citri]
MPRAMVRCLEKVVLQLTALPILSPEKLPYVNLRITARQELAAGASGLDGFQGEVDDDAGIVLLQFLNNIRVLAEDGREQRCLKVGAISSINAAEGTTRLDDDRGEIVRLAVNVLTHQKYALTVLVP